MKHDLEVLQYKAVKAHHSNHKLANVSQLLRVTKMRVVCFLRKFHYQYIHKNLLDESTAVC